jgi:hypothetical protein
MRKFRHKLIFDISDLRLPNTSGSNLVGKTETVPVDAMEAYARRVAHS